MHVTDLLALKEHLFATCKTLSVGKSNDYADHTDVLSNFRRGAAMFGMTIQQVLKTRLADKLSRLHQLTTGHKIAMVDEKIEDTVADAHNYLDLLYVSILEEYDHAKLDASTKPDTSTKHDTNQTNQTSLGTA